MARFTIGWYAHGQATVEADDHDEALDTLHEALMTFDGTMFEDFEVRGTGVENE